MRTDFFDCGGARACHVCTMTKGPGVFGVSVDLVQAALRVAVRLAGPARIDFVRAALPPLADGWRERIARAAGGYLVTEWEQPFSEKRKKYEGVISDLGRTGFGPGWCEGWHDIDAPGWILAGAMRSLGDGARGVFGGIGAYPVFVSRERLQ